jgi:hypothetical protein
VSEENDFQVSVSIGAIKLACWKERRCQVSLASSKARSGAAVTVSCRVGVAGWSAQRLGTCTGAWHGKASVLRAMQHYHRLASDVNLEEEVELQRLEGGAPAATLTTGMQVDAVQWCTPVPAGTNTTAFVAATAVLMPQAAARAVDGAELLRPTRTSLPATTEGMGESAVARPARALKLRKKRMDRRDSHWQCTYCAVLFGRRVAEEEVTVIAIVARCEKPKTRLGPPQAQRVPMDGYVGLLHRLQVPRREKAIQHIFVRPGTAPIP